MVEVPRPVGKFYDVALVTSLETEVAIEVENGMRVLETDLYVFRIFVGFEEIRDLVVVVGIVEDVGRRESKGITGFLQPLHEDFEQTKIGWFSLIKLLIEGFFSFCRGAAHKNDDSNYFNPFVPFLCRIKSSPRSYTSFPRSLLTCEYFSCSSTLVNTCSSSILMIFFRIKFWKS